MKLNSLLLNIKGSLQLINQFDVLPWEALNIINEIESESEEELKEHLESLTSNYSNTELQKFTIHIINIALQI